ncbi:3-isopropylmalate dehydrogenase [Clostridia bacterium OttesenSCG-928-F22]|nr:3-isopropylmalate dehydrogenase [Clostridia bacterium OttesenSCG-928-F22]
MTVLPGDGIGPEVCTQAIMVLEKVAADEGFKVVLQEELIGGAAIDATGLPLPRRTLESCQQADAVLLGAVGGPKWDAIPPEIRPEKGLLDIRLALGLYANLRPAIVYAPLKSASPLKAELIENGLDIMIVRELTGGIYFGKRGREKKGPVELAFDTEEYTTIEIERIAHVAFALAKGRNKRLVSVDKANVLASSQLWRETVERVSCQYPDVALSHMYVDNAAMQLVRKPAQFDTLLTSNLFGDILSDEASQITGSIGMLPSASLGEGTFGLYEPVHGSAPELAGQDVANPIAAILSVSMMLRHSLNRPTAAMRIEKAVERVLEQGLRTTDIAADASPIGTRAMGAAIIEAMDE